MAILEDDGVPDEFVGQLLDGLCKDIFIWRMARSMVGSSRPEMRASAITRMRNAERRIRELVLLKVEDEETRIARQHEPESCRRPRQISRGGSSLGCRSTT